MSGDSVGAWLVLALALFLAGGILNCRLPRPIRILLVVGLGLRLAGSQVYYYLTEWIYGFGDYSTYYGVGRAWGDALVQGTLSGFSSPYVQSWCCTGFTVRVSGLAMILLGPDVHAAFLLFALIGYAGLVALAVAFARSHDGAPVEQYLAWLVFFPSLWYWPSALGKDALLLAGLGIAVMGFVGRRGRVGWLSLASGIGLVFMVRPQVAVVVVASMVVAFWIASDARWTLARGVQGVALILGGLVLTALASGALGIQLFSVGEIETYLEARGTASAFGGSAVVGYGGVTGVLLGVVNVLFRPFPFEARGVAALIAAAEVTVLWSIAIWKRREIVDHYRTHRRSRLLWFGIVFVSAYVLLTGLALANLGLIARQRVHIFPFLLMFFVGRRAAGARRLPAGLGSGRTRTLPVLRGADGARHRAM